MELLHRPKLAGRSLGRRWPSVSPENVEAERAAGEGKVEADWGERGATGRFLMALLPGFSPSLGPADLGFQEIYLYILSTNCSWGSLS